MRTEWVILGLIVGSACAGPAYLPITGPSPIRFRTVDPSPAPLPTFELISFGNNASTKNGATAAVEPNSAKGDATSAPADSPTVSNQPANPHALPDDPEATGVLPGTETGSTNLVAAPPLSPEANAKSDYSSQQGLDAVSPDRFLQFFVVKPAAGNRIETVVGPIAATNVSGPSLPGSSKATYQRP